MAPLRALLGIVLAASCSLSPAARCQADGLLPWIKPEQKTICVRHPSQLPHVALPDVPPPPTVSSPQWDAPAWNLSLDEAIRTTLSNAEIIRVLAGATAVSSGRSIYDAAISNSGIDIARGRFDPTVSAFNTWRRNETASLNPLANPRTTGYDLNFQLSKTNLLGGFWSFGVNDNTTRIAGPALLDPSIRNSLDLGYTQPLLQGGGLAVNRAPIVLARIDTERSYFQHKSSVQNMVLSVIQAYWSLVSARTSLWAREQQVTQLEFALRRAEAQQAAELASISDVAQARVSLASFRSALIAAKADVVQSEAALRSILGLPVTIAQRITPSTPPQAEQLDFDWDAILSLAEEYRPDLIELKLILQADEQRLLQARNTASPQLDAVGLYNWNGLEGVSPLRDNTGWTLGINFSVPLGMRAARAQLRQQELIIARDRANLVQGLQTASFDLYGNLRNLDQYYEQYRATLETRAAAQENLDAQIASYQQGLTQYIVVLQAIVSWGDAVSSEAQLLALYNTELANLQLQTGTILETHGVYFFEERYRSLGPLLCLGHGQCYPRAKRPTDNEDIYPVGDEPSEEFFELTDPLESTRQLQRKARDVLPPLEVTPPLELPPDEMPEELPEPPTPQLQQPVRLLPGA